MKYKVINPGDVKILMSKLVINIWRQVRESRN